MGHIIRWDNDAKTVVFQGYTAPAVKGDLYHLASESAEMLKSLDHTVHLIIDETAIKLTLTSADIKFLEKNVPPNQGAVVMIVTPDNLKYKQMVQDISKMFAPKAFDKPYFATSLEEARELLQKYFGVKYP
ncbi:MAG: hypothetical protein R3E39_18805 [Anaerolineae bacterium]